MDSLAEAVDEPSRVFPVRVRSVGHDSFEDAANRLSGVVEKMPLGVVHQKLQGFEHVAWSGRDERD